MPCDLAVSITKAVVEDAHLQSLLTPAVTAAIVRAVLQNTQYAIHNPAVQIDGDRVRVAFGTFELLIERGTVTGQGGRAMRGLAERFADDLAAALAQAAQALLADQIRQTLAGYGQVAMTQEPVENQGAVQRAYVLRVML